MGKRRSLTESSIPRSCHSHLTGTRSRRERATFRGGGENREDAAVHGSREVSIREIGNPGWDGEGKVEEVPSDQ